jgi:hypothetical protein
MFLCHKYHRFSMIWRLWSLASFSSEKTLWKSFISSSSSESRKSYILSSKHGWWFHFEMVICHQKSKGLKENCVWSDNVLNMPLHYWMEDFWQFFFFIMTFQWENSGAFYSVLFIYVRCYGNDAYMIHFQTYGCSPWSLMKNGCYRYKKCIYFCLNSLNIVKSYNFFNSFLFFTDIFH